MAGKKKPTPLEGLAKSGWKPTEAEIREIQQKAEEAAKEYRERIRRANRSPEERMRDWVRSLEARIEALEKRSTPT